MKFEMKFKSDHHVHTYVPLDDLIERRESIRIVFKYYLYTVDKNCACKNKILDISCKLAR